MSWGLWRGFGSQNPFFGGLNMDVFIHAPGPVPIGLSIGGRTGGWEKVFLKIICLEEVLAYDWWRVLDRCCQL